MMSRYPNNEGAVKGDVGEFKDWQSQYSCLNHVSIISGPKIYNSPAIPESYGKASTALHMDMMDAVNLSLFSAKSSQSSPRDGAAIWHIFPASSCEHIRTYLNTKYQNDPNRPPGDPIHGQWAYLTDDMLEELEVQTGVRPWVIYQAPGDTIFIPSRCPHQVCGAFVHLDFLTTLTVYRI